MREKWKRLRLTVLWTLQSLLLEPVQQLVTKTEALLKARCGEYTCIVDHIITRTLAFRDALILAQSSLTGWTIDLTNYRAVGEPSLKPIRPGSRDAGLP
jgi:hypothetical protein